jgi:hypothetical protein
MRGFESKWVNWIECILMKGSVGLSINNVEGEFFPDW